MQGLGIGAIATVAGCLGGDSAEIADDWQAVDLEDATTGETFQIETLDRPTLVHTFSSNCLACSNQQSEFVRLYDRRDDIEIVELSVDPNDTPEAISGHAADAGLEWHVGVSPEPVTGALVEEFGQAISVSAQSPVVVVCPDGTTTTVSKVADQDELEAAIDDAC